LNQKICNIIVSFIRKNQGAIAENIVRGLKDNKRSVGRVKVFRILEDLKKENIVTVEQSPQNRRENKLFVNLDNPAVYVPLQLEEIYIAFKNLLDKSERKWQDLEEIIEDEMKTLKLNVFIKSLVGAESLLYFVPTMVLRVT
jgi:hypothetical protein